MSDSQPHHERTPLLQTENDLIKTGGTDVYGTETVIDEVIERLRPSSTSSGIPISSVGVSPSMVVLVLTIGVLYCTAPLSLLANFSRCLHCPTGHQLRSRDSQQHRF
jgi:hypothetical protein